MQPQSVVRRTETGKTSDDRDEALRLRLSITEYSPLPLIAVEGLFHIVRYANPAFCRLSGVRAEELIGCPFAEAVPENSENGCLSLLDRVYRTHQAENLAEQEHLDAHAGPIFWSYAAWAVRGEAEGQVDVMLQVSDATEIALFRRHATGINQALVLSGVRQHELTELAEGLNVRLKRAMRETNHRVKNNLQVVTSLAEMELKRENPTVLTPALQRIILHVRTLAVLHDILTQHSMVTPEDQTLDTQDALYTLLPLLQATVGARQLYYEVGPLTLTLHKSASLSLLISELVSNAVKHGQGDIYVALECDGIEARLEVRDAGQGFPDGFDPSAAAHTGLELTLSLARHDLRGEITFCNSPGGGGCVCCVFPVAPDR